MAAGDFVVFEEAMAYMLDGGHDGLMSVRRYLDAWRGGIMGFGAPEGSFEAVTEDDLVFA